MPPKTDPRILRVYRDHSDQRGVNLCPEHRGRYFQLNPASFGAGEYDRGPCAHCQAPGRGPGDDRPATAGGTRGLSGEQFAAALATAKARRGPRPARRRSRFEIAADALGRVADEFDGDDRGQISRVIDVLQRRETGR